MLLILSKKDLQKPNAAVKGASDIQSKLKRDIVTDIFQFADTILFVEQTGDIGNRKFRVVVLKSRTGRSLYETTVTDEATLQTLWMYFQQSGTSLL